jgi:hypothetical protein
MEKARQSVLCTPLHSLSLLADLAVFTVFLTWWRASWPRWGCQRMSRQHRVGPPTPGCPMQAPAALARLATSYSGMNV